MLVERSVLVDREDVIEGDASEGSESREGSEENKRDEERSESSQGSTKECMQIKQTFSLLWLGYFCCTFKSCSITVWLDNWTGSKPLLLDTFSMVGHGPCLCIGSRIWSYICLTKYTILSLSVLLYFVAYYVVRYSLCPRQISPKGHK